MLQVANRVSEADDRARVRASPVADAALAPLSSIPGGISPQPGGRYGEQPRFKASALALTILLHILVIALLFGLRQQAFRHDEQRLISVNLTPPPPPPQAQPPETPEVRQPVVTVPPPALLVNPVKAEMAVVVDPQPAPPEPVAAPAAPPAPPVSAPVSVVQDGDLGARMISGKPPRYPIESRRKKEQGTVVLLLILGQDGTVEQISVSKSSGFGRLDDAALNAVRKWRWQPIMRGGQPVKVRGTVEIPFVLQA